MAMTMQHPESPTVYARPESLVDDMLNDHDIPRTSFLDPSTPGYSDTDWRTMAVLQNGTSPSSTQQPLTPRADSFQNGDSLHKHLLVETAMFDSSKFDILPIQEVDGLKKEKLRVDSRIDAARRKLALESKVRDAARSLHRLYSQKGQTHGRPEKERRKSLLGDRRSSTSSTKSDSASQAGDELQASNRKVEELVQILVGLENRRQYIESRLLRHTAAVLQAAHDEREANANKEESTEPLPYIRDYDQGVMGDNTKDQSLMHNNQLLDVNTRLELLNGQMRSLISQAKKGRQDIGLDNSPDDIPSAYPEDEDPQTRIDNQLEHLQTSIFSLVQEHQRMSQTRETMLNDTKHDQHATEGRLEGVNNQLYSLLSASAHSQHMFDLQPPPHISGHGSQQQIDYLEESLLTIEQMIQQTDHIQDSHKDLSRELDDLRIKTDAHGQKSSQYESVMLGLWGILTAKESSQANRDMDSDDEDLERTDSEPFSVQAFNTKVQQLFARVGHLDDQTEILRRQIQQQRDLAGKTDVEEATRNQDLEEAKEREQEAMEREQEALEELEAHKKQIEEAMEREQQALEELETHRKQVEEARGREQEVLEELEAHRKQVEELQDHVGELETSIAEHEDEARIANIELQHKESEHIERLDELSESLGHANTAKENAEADVAKKAREMDELESEMVRLTTELTMAKAELDGAYGSRSERAREMASHPGFQELEQKSKGMAVELEQLQQERRTHETQMLEMLGLHQQAEARSISLEQEMLTLREIQASGTRDDSRMHALEKELADMATDYQELTRETVEMEKEREKIEGVVDALRERIEGLEMQLSDEKVKWLGIRSPSGTPELGNTRETTSTMVLRNEFKKMMRETRAEGVKMLRAEQEQRRQIEAQLRNLRREKNGGVSPRVGLASPGLRVQF